jgi:hypothetical protein
MLKSAMAPADVARWDALQGAKTTEAANELRPLFVRAETALRARLWALFGEARNQMAPKPFLGEEAATTKALADEHAKRMEQYSLRHVAEPLTAFTLDDKIDLLKRSCLMGYKKSARFKDCTCQPWFDKLKDGARFHADFEQQFTAALAAKDMALLAPPKAARHRPSLFGGGDAAATAAAAGGSGGDGGGGGDAGSLRKRGRTT